MHPSRRTTRRSGCTSRSKDSTLIPSASAASLRRSARRGTRPGSRSGLSGGTAGSQASPRASFATSGCLSRRGPTEVPTRETAPQSGSRLMELAGLEPATSWVRYRVREPNRGDLSSLGCSKFSSVRSAALSLVPHVVPRRARGGRARGGEPPPCSRRFGRCDGVRLVSARRCGKRSRPD